MEDEVRIGPAAGVPPPLVGLPLWIVVEATLATFVAVVFVHLFAGPIEPTGAFAAHALLITGAYSAAFAVTYLALQRLQRTTLVQRAPTPILAAALSAVACLLGSVVLGALKDVGGAVGAVIDVHDDANWLLKLLPLWVVMTGVLYQSERTRLLESELRRLGQIRSQEALARAAVGPRTIEIGAGKAVSLSVDDVSHIVAVENYCEVHFVERAGRKPLLVRATLSSVIEQLPGGFVRTHRSYVVNLACVESIEKSGRAYTAALGDGRAVPVSRMSVDDVSARWRDFLRAGTSEGARQ